jgi:type IV pilus assembly protein PilV
MKSQRILKNQDGVVLVEGLIAIVIFAFGILAIIGMQGATVRQSTDAKYRVDAAFVVNQTLGTMWAADRTNLAAFAATNKVVSSLPDGKLTVVVGAPTANNNVPVTVSVSWQSPGEKKAHTHMSTTLINR